MRHLDPPYQKVLRKLSTYKLINVNSAEHLSIIHKNIKGSKHKKGEEKEEKNLVNESLH